MEYHTNDNFLFLKFGDYYHKCTIYKIVAQIKINKNPSHIIPSNRFDSI